MTVDLPPPGGACTTADAPPSTGPRRITLDAAGIPLSALLATPPTGGAPRATVLALHGGGMTAGYFDARAHPGQSLLTLGARLGYTVLALDRPGYGASTPALPTGQTLADQSATIRTALAHYTATHDLGAGVFVLGHSYGGKLALTCAADGLPAPCSAWTSQAWATASPYRPTTCHRPAVRATGNTTGAPCASTRPTRSAPAPWRRCPSGNAPKSGPGPPGSPRSPPASTSLSGSRSPSTRGGGATTNTP